MSIVKDEALAPSCEHQRPTSIHLDSLWGIAMKSISTDQHTWIGVTNAVREEVTTAQPNKATSQCKGRQLNLKAIVPKWRV